MIRILIPLDGSALAEQALGHAIAISKVFSAELMLLRVVTESTDGPVDCIDWQLQRRQASAYLESVADKLRGAGCVVRAAIEEGQPAAVIGRFCQDHQIDLIVLCRFGRGGVTRFGRGSVAQKVIAAASASVLLVGPEEGATDDGRGISYERILVPVDGTSGSEWGLSMGAMIAQIHGADLYIAHAIERPQIPTRMPRTKDVDELYERVHRHSRAESARRLEELKAQLPGDLKVTTRILATRDIARTLHTMSETIDADLIVLTAHGSPSEHDWRYGTVCESLLSHATRPVLVFQQRELDVTANRFRSLYLAELQADAG